MNRYLRAFCLCLGLAALACAEPGADSAEVVTVGFQDSQVRRMTFEELDQRKIWYEPAGDNAIRFKMENVGDITRIVEELTYEILPPERSANYVEPFLTEFLKRLDKANVPYEVIEYGDLDTQPGENDGLPVEWVVWPEEHSAEVARIRDALDRDALWDDFANE
jgi:hypothetical protein